MLGNVSRQVIVLIATVLRAILVLCVKVSVCLPGMQALLYPGGPRLLKTKVKFFLDKFGGVCCLKVVRQINQKGREEASCPVDMLSNLNKEDYFCIHLL